MPFAVRCPECETRFALSEQLFARKVQGRVVGVRCKHCQHELSVDGTRHTASDGASAEHTLLEATSKLAPAKPASVSAAAPSSPRAAHPPLAGLWVVRYGEDDDRELTLAQVRRAFERGEIDEHTPVWRDGMAEAEPLSKVSELGSIVAARAPEAEPSSPAPEDDSSEASVDDDLGRPSGAPRLSALTAASARSVAPPPKRADRLDAEILKLGVTNPVLDPPTIDPNPTIDAPTIDTPTIHPSSRTEEPLPRTTRSNEIQPERSRSPWPWLVLAVGLAVSVWWLIVRPLGSSPAPAPAASVANEPRTSTISAPAAPSRPAPEPSVISLDPEPGEKTAPTPTAAAKPEPEREPEPEPEPAANEPEPAASASEPEPRKSPELPPFDAAGANAALAAAALRAATCRKPADPSGVANVTVTFAPSGRVTTAIVSGPPFAGTPTGGCIATQMRGASVSPFGGERVTVTKTVVIR